MINLTLDATPGLIIQRVELGNRPTLDLDFDKTVAVVHFDKDTNASDIAAAAARLNYDISMGKIVLNVVIDGAPRGVVLADKVYVEVAGDDGGAAGSNNTAATVASTQARDNSKVGAPSTTVAAAPDEPSDDGGGGGGGAAVVVGVLCALAVLGAVVFAAVYRSRGKAAQEREAGVGVRTPGVTVTNDTFDAFGTYADMTGAPPPPYDDADAEGAITVYTNTTATANEKAPVAGDEVYADVDSTPPAPQHLVPQQADATYVEPTPLVASAAEYASVDEEASWQQHGNAGVGQAPVDDGMYEMPGGSDDTGPIDDGTYEMPSKPGGSDSAVAATDGGAYETPCQAAAASDPAPAALNLYETMEDQPGISI